MDNFINIIVGVCKLLLAFIIVFLFLNRNRYTHSVLLLIAAYSISFFGENIGTWFNVIITAPYLLFTNSFLFYFFIELFLIRIVDKKYAYILFGIVILLSILNGIDAYYIHFNEQYFQYYNHLFATMLLFIIMVVFLYETFNSDNIFKLKSYLPFWLVGYLLICTVGTLPIILLSTTKNDVVSPYFFSITLNIIILLGYIIFIIGLFKCRVKKNNG